MNPRTSLGDDLRRALAAELAPVDALLAARYPGEPADRQPVHTVYVPADRFDADVPRRWGEAARDSVLHAGGSLPEFARIVGTAPKLMEAVYPRVVAKLAREPIEDLRVDFEDGYGRRPDEEEDAEAVRIATAIASLRTAAVRPPYVGVRIKPLEAATRDRAIRTLDLLVTALAAADGVPAEFLITVPKVSLPPQVSAASRLCEQLESELGLPVGRLRFEIQVEMPQAILGPDGRVPVAGFLAAARGRCVGLHYGTYDYSAACGIAAAYQSMEHPAADFAKAVMQVAAAGTGVRLSDGSTNVLPVGDRAAVRAAWELHARLVRRSLERGFYQGWDLHPAQLPTRFAATYAFFREGLPAAAARLRAYLGRADAGVLDEPATAQALSAYLQRGLECGAVDATEVENTAGASRADLERLRRRAVEVLTNED